MFYNCKWCWISVAYDSIGLGSYIAKSVFELYIYIYIYIYIFVISIYSHWFWMHDIHLNVAVFISPPYQKSELWSSYRCNVNWECCALICTKSLTNLNTCVYAKLLRGTPHVSKKAFNTKLNWHLFGNFS